VCVRVVLKGHSWILYPHGWRSLASLSVPFPIDPCPWPSSETCRKVDEMIVEEIREIAEAENVAVLGFGQASAMAGAPLGYRPEDLLPGARGLVCFGIPLPRAIYHLS
jgi:hypothetical protein